MSGEDAKERGFSRAVSSDESDMFSGSEQEVLVVNQDACADGDMESVGGKYDWCISFSHRISRNFVDGELAVDGAILEGELGDWRHMDIAQALGGSGENGDATVVHTHHGVAEFLVELVGGIEAHTIRRVGNHEAPDTIVALFAEGHGSEGEFVGQTGVLGVGGGEFEDRGVEVAAGNLRELSGGVAPCLSAESTHGVGGLGIEVRPAFEAEALAEDAWGDVGGPEGAFDEKGSGAAHGVEERRLAVPVGESQDGGGEGFLDRCFTAGDAVSALEEWLSGEVEVESRLATSPMDESADVGSR